MRVYKMYVEYIICIQWGQNIYKTENTVHLLDFITVFKRKVVLVDCSCV